MKPIFYIIAFIILSQTVFAQNVGINNTDPQVSLDINGALAHRSFIIDPFMNNVNIPVDASFVIISNVDVTGPVSIFAPEYIDGKRLIIYNNSGFTATFNYMTAIQNGETKEFIGMNPGGYKLLTQPGQLEKITESGNTGWRLLGRDSINYGNIGSNAVDLSYSESPSALVGATGFYSTALGYGCTASGVAATAMGAGSVASGYISTAFGEQTTASGSQSTSIGYGTIASGDYTTAMGVGTNASGAYTTAMGTYTNATSYNSTAIGSFNDTIGGTSRTSWVATDPLLYVGNSFDGMPRSNAMVVYKNGTLFLQNQTTTPANSTDKFYILNNQPYFGTQKLQASQLEKITEGGNTGWRLLGQNPAHYGNIGFDAVDLSNSNSVSSTRGASGNYSTALGNNTTASGIYATAMGLGTNASGNYATSMGFYTTASGNYATAMGHLTTASGENSTAMGLGTTASGFYSTASGQSSIASGVSSMAMGLGTTASSFYSTAMGHNTIASGESSTAMGFATTAIGFASTSMGHNTTAIGVNSLSTGNSTFALGDQSVAMGNTNTTAYGVASVAIGKSTKSSSFVSLAIGQYNDTIVGANPTSWIATDPLLTLGNGSSNAARSNAVTIYKNGNTDLNGYVRLGKITDDAPRIKVKKITGNSPSVDGFLNYPHLVDAAKIIGVEIFMQYGASPIPTKVIPPGYTLTGNHHYQYEIDGVNIRIQNVVGQSGQIGGKPLRIMITYEE